MPVGYHARKGANCSNCLIVLRFDPIKFRCVNRFCRCFCPASRVLSGLVRSKHDKNIFLWCCSRVAGTTPLAWQGNPLKICRAIASYFGIQIGFFTLKIPYFARLRAAEAAAQYVKVLRTTCFKPRRGFHVLRRGRVPADAGKATKTGFRCNRPALRA